MSTKQTKKTGARTYTHTHTQTPAYISHRNPSPLHNDERNLLAAILHHVHPAELDQRRVRVREVVLVVLLQYLAEELRL